jgi:N-acetylglucosaminyldiphosphoundecaprenol N-acetyl-beta-D-mannosaminyltransferase
MSMPVDERWALENRHRLNVGAIVLGAGCFEWLSGKTTVAPRWLTELHLEWLFRLIQEPGRLWKRYILGNPLFILRILKERYHRAK